jgi:hypothetical protein
LVQLLESAAANIFMSHTLVSMTAHCKLARQGISQALHKTQTAALSSCWFTNFTSVAVDVSCDDCTVGCLQGAWYQRRPYLIHAQQDPGNCNGSIGNRTDVNMLLELKLAEEQLYADPHSAAAVVQLVCSRICAAAARSYRPSDQWLGRAWQLLERSWDMQLDSAAAVLAAAYATAVTLKYTDRDFAGLLSGVVQPPNFTSAAILRPTTSAAVLRPTAMATVGCSGCWHLMQHVCRCIATFQSPAGCLCRAWILGKAGTMFMYLTFWKLI